jgi:hypothetical protein
MNSPTKVRFRGEEFLVLGHSQMPDGAVRLQCKAAPSPGMDAELWDGDMLLTTGEVQAATVELTVLPAKPI